MLRSIHSKKELSAESWAQSLEASGALYCTSLVAFSSITLAINCRQGDSAVETLCVAGVHCAMERIFGPTDVLSDSGNCEAILSMFDNKGCACSGEDLVATEAVSKIMLVVALFGSKH